MKIKLLYIALILIAFGCKKKELSDIGIELQTPREGLVIQFNGGARTYPIRINIRSEKLLDKVEYKITNTANNSQLSAYLEDDYRNGEKDILLEITETMPAGNTAIDAKIVATVTDIAGYTQSKTANFRLVP